MQFEYFLVRSGHLVLGVRCSRHYVLKGSGCHEEYLGSSIHYGSVVHKPIVYPGNKCYIKSIQKWAHVIHVSWGASEFRYGTKWGIFRETEILNPRCDD